jgi:hypothetical protein
LRGAQEVSSLVRDLPATCIPVSQGTALSPDEARAVATVLSAAKILDMLEAALCTTLHQVAADPYTQFINKVWH